jgi:uncharacterized protein (DUF736 family)
MADARLSSPALRAFLARQETFSLSILRCAAAASGAVRSPLGLAITIKTARGGLITGRKVHMATIGNFTKSENGYAGTIRTLTVNAKIRFALAEKDKENAPDYRVLAGTAEIGAAWKKTSEAGREYVSVKLEDPSFPAAIYATLVESEGDTKSLVLIWTRRNGN